jgi:argininosuccinate lyase
MKSPLGSGAGAGTSAEIDRNELAYLLGFLGISENTLYSTSSRIFLDALMRSLYMISVVLSRVANDYILFQTSSIMPQKRNPATLEIARARLKKIVSNSFYLGIVESGLPTGYSLDLQELTPVVWESIRVCKEAINVVFDFINKAKVNEEKVVELIEKGGVLATEIAEALSITKGIPYRLAHQKVASSLRKTNWDLARAVELIDKEEKVEVTKLVEWRKALTAKKVKGSPNPEFVKKNLMSLNERLDKLFFDVMQIKEKFSISVTNLLNVKVYE